MVDRSVVETTVGQLRGREVDGVRRFLGVPYAAPPIGPLRFEAPLPPEPWSGVRAADSYGPAPLQRVDELSLRLGLLADHPQSEDSLHLNVFAPAEPAERLRPVMVWLHGGAFLTGTAAGPVYDAAPLAREGGVVVVTLNYRVGALGFLALGAPNRGLQDQLAALRFVRGEIAAFGGDPDNVTVFGESAGAGSIVSLLAMPSARGLFQRAIVQSAAPEGMLSREEADLRAGLFAEAAGVSPGDRGAMDALDGEAIVAAQSACQEPGPRRIGMFFAPVVDGEVLPDWPLSAISAGSAKGIPLVIGTTANEMQLYHLSDAFPEIPDSLIPSIIASKLPGSRQGALEVATRLAELYSEPSLRGSDRFFAVETDASLFVPATRLAEAHARHVPETYMYRFMFRSPMAEGRLGACHALDVPFALGTIDRVPEFAGQGEPAERVGRALRAAWLSFARCGDPAGDSFRQQAGRWPRFEPERRATLLIGDPCRVAELPDEERRSAWATALRVEG